MPDAIDVLFAEWDVPGSPGCSVGIYRDGRLEDARGYGLASIEHGIPNGPDTSFYVGSVGKQFIAACAALLVRDGVVDPDADFRKILPAAEGLPEPVTLRQVLNHTSGIRDCYALQSVGGLPREAIDTEDAMRTLVSRQRSLNFEPGAAHLYSNSNYFFTAQTIAHVAGRPIAEFAHEHIFEPLGMPDTRFRPSWSEIVPNRATGYARSRDGWQVDESWVNVVAGGGIVTTVRNIAAWDRMFLDDSLGIAEIVLTRGRLNDGTELPYAWGLEHGEHGGRPTVSHGGAWTGFRSELLRFPDERLAVAVFANTTDMTPGALALRVADIVLPPLTGPAVATPPRVDIPSPETIAGLYRGRDGSPIYRLVAVDGSLEIEAGSRRLPVEVVDEQRLRVSGVEITFASLDPHVMRMNEDTELVRIEEIDAPDVDALRGRYESDELRTTLELVVEDGRLSFADGRPVKGLLVAVADAEFVVGGIAVRFEGRDMYLSDDRARNVRFARK